MKREKSESQNKAAKFWLGFVFVLLGSFMIGLSFMVYRAVSTRPELVSSNYYEEGLKFEERMEAQRNLQASKSDVKLTYSDSRLMFLLAEQAGVTGKLKIIRPSEQSLNQELEFSLNKQGLSIIDLELNGQGLWYVEYEWEFEGKPYYFKQSITVK